MKCVMEAILQTRPLDSFSQIKGIWLLPGEVSSSPEGIYREQKGIQGSESY